LRSVKGRVEREQKGGLVQVVNAAGVVLHTGLGRAPIHPEAARAMEVAARSYGTLEVDRFSGRRNQRDERLGELLARMTGAEDGIVVNNNAAAVLLMLSTFAAGKETVVSRGELVEIGGSFRIPDVMVRANTKMVECGTTNRTRADDYRQAAGPDTGLLIKVHTSNFRVVGFTEELDAPDLARLGQELGVVTAFDLGSGLLEGPEARPLDMLGGEPLVRDSVAAGVDIVTFSGDKLLGGPQAGLIVGKREAVARMRKNPMYRALRLDKVTIAGLEATLGLYLAGRADEIPARRMMLLQPDELRPVAEGIAAELSKLDGFTAEVIDDASQPGSGSAPGIFLPSPVVRLTCERWSAEELSARLRAGEPSVFARIHDDRLLLDPRTLLEGDRESLLDAVRRLQ
jgi:L-seryl-tRNA(Ser) seleniumtransferase